MMASCMWAPPPGRRGRVTLASQLCCPPGRSCASPRWTTQPCQVDMESFVCPEHASPWSSSTPPPPPCAYLPTPTHVHACTAPSPPPPHTYTPTPTHGKSNPKPTPSSIDDQHPAPPKDDQTTRPGQHTRASIGCTSLGPSPLPHHPHPPLPSSTTRTPPPLPLPGRVHSHLRPLQQHHKQRHRHPEAPKTYTTTLLPPMQAQHPCPTNM
jgi:hypothetical protein